ncbi:MAG: hypothetical protein JOZ73_13155 [Solirubrobacterales bacterium]|nr:hypothetical protein [Solirubrobacterales bacterium]
MNEQRQPTEEELRAAYEAEIKKIRVEHVVLEHVVTLVNLGMRRTGLAPGTEEERDLTQVRMAIEAIRPLLPLLEQTAPEQAGPIKEALSQLQLAFVKIGGESGEEAAAEGEGDQAAEEAASTGAGPAPPPGAASEKSQSEGPGPAQRSGKLWVPGQ